MSSPPVLKRSLGRRLTVVFGLFVAAAMTVLVVLVGLRLHRTVSDNLTAQLENRARQDARLLLHRFEFLLDAVAVLVKSPLVVNGIIDAPSRQSYLPELVKNFREGRDVQAVALLDYDGKPVYSTLDSLPTFGDSSELRQALASGTMSYRLDAGRGQWIVFAPIVYYNTTQGALVVVYDVSAIAARILAADPLLGHELRQGSQTLFRHEASRTGDLLRVEENLASLGTGFLAGMNLTLEVSALSDFYLAPARNAVRDMVILGVLLTLAALFVARWLARRIAQPILLLAERIDAADGNDPRACGPLGTDDELELLARKFDERTRDLRAIQLHLEELVDRRTQELVEAKQAAEDASYLKSSFLASMSHEIRTPLNAIIGLTHIVRRNAVEPRQIAQLDKVIGAARHLLSLINNVLDFSKIEAGKLTVEEEDFDFQTLLDDLRTLVGERIAEKDLDFVVDIDPAVPLRVRGDSLRLNQVLINFTSNAVKFTERGSITLRVRRLGSPDAPLRLRFEVADTGIGMTAEESGRLFQPFEQADSSTTRRYGGTGLGLAISRRLVELMGGTLGVQSTAGTGSTFWFEVPLGLAANGPLAVDRPAPRLAVSGTRFAGLRVLLVEDNPVNQEVAADLLQGLGMRVDLANDGVEALEQAATTRYDLILIDMQMPRLDGIGATRALRERPATAAVPIIAMTANAFAEDRERCLEAGMNGFVAKPVDPEALLAVFERCLVRTAVGPVDGPGGSLPPPAADAVRAVAAPVHSPVPGTPPVAAGESDLRAHLEAIDGLDVAAGLRVFRDRLPSYVRVLRKFVDSYDDEAEKLVALVAAGQAAEATLLAHSMKGSTASLGFAAVHVLVRKIEAALKAGLTQDHPALQQDLEELRVFLPGFVARLREVLDEADSV